MGWGVAPLFSLCPFIIVGWACCTFVVLFWQSVVFSCIAFVSPPSAIARKNTIEIILVLIYIWIYTGLPYIYYVIYMLHFLPFFWLLLLSVFCTSSKTVPIPLGWDSSWDSSSTRYKPLHQLVVRFVVTCRLSGETEPTHRLLHSPRRLRTRHSRSAHCTAQSHARAQ